MSQPTLFNNTGAFYQQIDFNSGWTWISLNVNDIDFQNINMLTQGMTLETSDRITSNTSEGAFIDLYYNDLSNPNNSGWNGSISSNGGLSSSEMYKVFLTNEQSLIINGSKVDISTWEFDVQENWNWLPYPYNSNHSVNEVLALFNAEDGDVIKSQTKFAIYDPINGWSGTLNNLKSGEGYMLKAVQAQTLSFPTYLNTSARTPNNGITEADETINPNFSKLSNTMNAVVKLPQGYDKLFVYDTHGQLKGYNTVSENRTNGLAYITIYGEETEDLKFFVSNGGELKQAKNPLVFSNNAVLGKTQNPIRLELFSDSVIIHPNPFEKEFVLDFNVSSNQEVSLKLFNTTNQLILSKTIRLNKGPNSYKMTKQLSSGVYFVQIKMKDEIITKKIIKK